MNTVKHLLKYCFTTVMLFVELTIVQAQVLPPKSNKEVGQASAMEQAVQKHLMNDYNKVKPYFEEAYRRYPSIPRGVLEAVSYTYTRFAQMSSDTLESNTLSIPRTYSVMGLTLNGKGVFRENLRLVSSMSVFPLSSLILDDRCAILAYASAFSKLQQMYGCYGDDLEKYCPIFVALSELPCPNSLSWNLDFSTFDLKDSMNLYPLCSSIYAIYSFLSDSSKLCLGSMGAQVDFIRLFGPNLSLLQKSAMTITVGEEEKSSRSVESDYTGAIWCPAASCNYARGRSLTTSNVVVHYTSGTYAGSIAWFQNCQASASAHYVIRSMDGQITQMVSEADRAWHVGNENGYTIGIEHEAYGNIYSYFTPVMYQASANLVRDICRRRPNIHSTRMFYRDTLDDGSVLNNGVHNLGGSSACPQIRGHQHYPSQTHTDPGPYWNWNYYFKLINPTIIDETRTDSVGVFTDSGGEMGNYSNGERRLTWIHIAGADSIVLEFSDFDLEADYDFMWIYNGSTPFAPLIGRWNTRNPGRVVASGEDMLVEFRSDCDGTRRGWRARWHSCSSAPQVQDIEPPVTRISWDENEWLTDDADLQFVDTDDVAVKYRFYQIIERQNSEWYADSEKGEICDNFDHSLDASLWTNDGNWCVENGALRQRNIDETTTCVAAHCNGNVSSSYLFDFYLSMDVGEKCSFFFNANTSSFSSNSFSAYCVEFDKLQHAVSIYKIKNGIPTLLQKQTGIYYTSGQSYLYRICWDKQIKCIKVFRHSALLTSVNDSENSLPAVGNYIGFSTQNAAVTIDNLRSYIARSESLLLTVGANPSSIIQTQARNGVANCKLKSIVMDGADKFSPLVEKSIKVDYTPPTCPTNVIDGFNTDEDVISTSNLITASWSASQDGESGVASYLYELSIYDKGSLPRFVSGRVCYPNTSLRTSLKQVYPSRVIVKVKAKDNAGLESEYSSSDGVLYVGNSPAFNGGLVVTPNQTVSSKIILKNADGVCEQKWEEINPIASLYDVSGRLVMRQRLDQSGEISLENCPKGLYVLRVEANERILWSGKLVKE